MIPRRSGTEGWRLQRGPMQRLFGVVGWPPAQVLQPNCGGTSHKPVRVNQGGKQGWDQPRIGAAPQGLGGGQPQDGIMIFERLRQYTEGDLVANADGGVRSARSWPGNIRLIKFGQHFGGGLTNPVIVALERVPQSRDRSTRLLQFFPVRIDLAERAGGQIADR